MTDKIKVVARSKEEAMELARKELAIEGNVALNIVEVGKKGGLLGLGGKKVYEVSLQEGLTQREKDLLALVSDGLDVDGTFKIKVADDGVFLKITPPEGRGDPVSYQLVRLALEKKEIVQIDWKAVQNAIHDATGEWVLIAPRLPELDRDGKVRVEISNDKLRAYISYTPALGGKELSAEDIIRILKENQVVYGIKEDRIYRFAEKPTQIDNFLVAEGTPAVPGKDAEIIYHFEKKKESVGTQREDGSIDFFNLGLITNVNAGQVLVTKKEPVPGIPGKTVTGEVIEPPVPRNRELPGGKNVEKRDDNTLVATIAGQVVVEGNRISVLPVYEVNGDVDLSTGNIEFVGNVLVKGNVMEGFKVKASGNVEVWGHVFGATIEADGDVVIRKGFVGRNKAHIHARGSVQVKFIENGIVKADKDIIVSDAIMHSNISAGEMVQVTRNKGLLVGGVTRAGRLIEANIIGSYLATSTELEVGIDPELKNRLKEMEEEIQKSRLNLDKTLKAIDILEKLKKQQGELPEEKRLMLLRLQATATKLQEDIGKRKLEYDEEKSKLDETDKGRINIYKMIYPGVKIVIGKSAYNIYNTMNRTSFIEEEGEVRQITL